MTESEKIVMQYCKDVKSGKILSGHYLKKAVERFLNDLKRKDDESFDFIMCWDKVEQFRRFAEVLKIPHVEGKFSFLPWQLFIFANLLGFRYKSDTSKKRFREGAVLVARKNGKTVALEEVLLIWDLLTTPEAGVYLFSADEKMVENTYQEIVKTLKAIPEIADIVQPKTFVTTYKDSRMQWLSPESCADSYNVSLSICDEVWNWSSFKAVQAMKYGSRARKNALVFMISTAGDDTASPLYDYQKNKMEKVLDGIYDDPYSFYAIWAADEGDAWDSREAYIKANPAIGYFLDEKIISQDLQDAVNLPSRRHEYECKTINRWTSGETSWINLDMWQQNKMELPLIDDYKDNNWYAGLDASESGDWTALSFYTYDSKEDKFITWHYFFIPEESVKTKYKTENISLTSWIAQKYVITTPGKTIDYSYIKKTFFEFASEYKVVELAYDPWHTKALIDEMDAENGSIVYIPFSQSLKSISPVAREWEKAIIDGKIIDNNKVMLWMVSNVIVKPDVNNNIKPMKKYKSSTAKIDGVISSIMAFSRCIAGMHSEKPATIKDFDTLLAYF